VRFYHQLLQEYFAAWEVLKRIAPPPGPPHRGGSESPSPSGGGPGGGGLSRPLALALAGDRHAAVDST